MDNFSVSVSDRAARSVRPEVAINADNIIYELNNLDVLFPSRHFNLSFSDLYYLNSDANYHDIVNTIRSMNDLYEVDNLDTKLDGTYFNENMKSRNHLMQLIAKRSVTLKAYITQLEKAYDLLLKETANNFQKVYYGDFGGKVI